MILGRLIMRFLLVPLGAMFAVSFATLTVIVAQWHRFAEIISSDPDGRDGLVVALMVVGPMVALAIIASALVMMVPASLGVLIAEAFAIRSWMFHVANGALSAWVGWATFVETQQPYNFYTEPLVIVAAGIVAGFVYWAIAGSSAGFWKPVFARPIEPAPGDPLPPS
jgi:hypothetical protein